MESSLQDDEETDEIQKKKWGSDEDGEATEQENQKEENMNMNKRTRISTNSITESHNKKRTK